MYLRLKFRMRIHLSSLFHFSHFNCPACITLATILFRFRFGFRFYYYLRFSFVLLVGVSVVFSVAATATAAAVITSRVSLPRSFCLFLPLASSLARSFGCLLLCIFPNDIDILWMVYKRCTRVAAVVVVVHNIWIRLRVTCEWEHMRSGGCITAFAKRE